MHTASGSYRGFSICSVVPPMFAVLESGPPLPKRIGEAPFVGVGPPLSDALSANTLYKSLPKFLVPDVPVVLVSGCAALPATEMVLVDAHFGLGTSWDDLLWTMRMLIGLELPAVASRRSMTQCADST